MTVLTTSSMMQTVLLALLPGLLCSSYFFGAGVFINVLVCVTAALAAEAGILTIRKMDLRPLRDGSAVLTGLLLGLALPPALPIWMAVLGSSFAIIFGKQLFGGLGQNPFNPAMVGYAAMIVSFPLAMSTWPDLLGVDGTTAATPLDIFRFRGAATIEELWISANGFAQVAGVGWQWINLAYLLPGLALIYLKVARWQAAASMLISITILAIVFYDNGSSQSLGSPLFHLFSGGTMLAAFFVVTDPVTAPGSDIGLYVYGAGIGLITFVIRSVGAYPDGFAFAVLIMNALTPLIDQLRLRTT